MRRQPPSATETFDARKDELLRTHPGEFALVCGRRLMGVHHTVEEALRAAAEAFGEGELDDGAPIFIRELSEQVPIAAAAEPHASQRDDGAAGLTAATE